MAFYLKYRPQTLDEIIGQEGIKTSLLSAFISQKLSHAYLFVGPRGTGKTSTARILAKMVNCEFLDNSMELSSTTVASVPCNKCSACISITDGSNLDLIEIDAASNRGIDDIRSLRETIKLSTTGSKKKIYIIDEVHMLTTEAFNALLKTLEEPPSHVLFILATTEAQKIPQTILSRVQRFDFKLANLNQLLQALTKVVEGEKIKIKQEVLKEIAKRADGSFRDAVKFLDQIANSDQEITLDYVSKFFHLTSSENLKLLQYLAEKKVKESIILISGQVEAGADVKVLTAVLIDLMRAMFLIKNDLGPNLVQPEYDSDQYQLLVKLSDKFSLESLTSNLTHLYHALERLKFSSIPSLPLEIAVVEMCGVGRNETIDDRKLKIGIEDRESKVEEKINPPSSTIKDPPSIIHNLSSNSDSSDILKLQDRWAFVLETIRPYNYSLEALLKKVKIVNVIKNEVVLEVPYSFHQRILEAPKARDLLESILADILGKSVQISCVLGKREIAIEELNNVEIAADDEIIRAASEIFNSETVN